MAPGQLLIAVLLIVSLSLIGIAQGQQQPHPALLAVGNLSVAVYNPLSRPPPVTTPKLAPASSYVWTIRRAALPAACQPSNSALFLELWHSNATNGSIVFEAGVQDADGRLWELQQDPHATISWQYQRIVAPLTLWDTTTNAAAWFVRVANQLEAAAPAALLQVACLPPGAPTPCPMPDPRSRPCGAHGECWLGGAAKGTASVCNCTLGWGGWACGQEQAVLQLADTAALTLAPSATAVFQLAAPKHRATLLQLKWAGAPLPFGHPTLCARPFSVPTAPDAAPLPPHTHPSWTCDAASAAALSPYHYLLLAPDAATPAGLLQVAVFNTAAAQEARLVLTTDAGSAAGSAEDPRCPFGCMGQRCAAASATGFECRCPSTLAGNMCETPRARRVVQGEATVVTFGPLDVAPGQAAWQEVEVPPSSAFNPGSDDVLVYWTVLPSSRGEASKLVLIGASGPDLHDPATHRSPPVTAASLPLVAATRRGLALSLRKAGLLPSGATRHRCYILVQNRDFTAAGPASYQLTVKLQHPPSPLWHRPGFWSMLVVPTVLAVGFVALLWGFWHWRHHRAAPATPADILEAARIAAQTGAGHPAAMLLADPRPGPLKPGVPFSLVLTFATYTYNPAAPPEPALPAAGPPGSAPAAGPPGSAPTAAAQQQLSAARPSSTGAQGSHSQPAAQRGDASSDLDADTRPDGAAAAGATTGGEVEMQAVLEGGRPVGAAGSEAGPPTCAVCLAEYEAGDRLRRLPCGHDFHCGCIDGWLRASTSCPICRRDLLAAPEPLPGPPLARVTAPASVTVGPAPAPPEASEAGPAAATSEAGEAGPPPAAGAAAAAPGGAAAPAWGLGAVAAAGAGTSAPAVPAVAPPPAPAAASTLAAADAGLQAGAESAATAAPGRSAGDAAGGSSAAASP